MVEADVPMVIQVGFVFITVIFIAVLAVIYLRMKRAPGWPFFLAQWGLTTMAVLRLVEALKYSGPMYTENVSYLIGQCGLLWGASIVCMLVGIWRMALSKQGRAVPG